MKIVLIIYLGLQLISSVKSHYKLSTKGIRGLFKDKQDEITEINNKLDSIEEFFGLGLVKALANVFLLINALIILFGLYYLTKVLS